MANISHVSHQHDKAERQVIDMGQYLMVLKTAHLSDQCHILKDVQVYGSTNSVVLVEVEVAHQNQNAHRDNMLLDLKEEQVLYM